MAHGDAYDRGGADSYYRRAYAPHIWPDGTGQGTRVEMKDMMPYEIVEYTKGYNENEQSGDFKEY